MTSPAPKPTSADAGGSSFNKWVEAIPKAVTMADSLSAVQVQKMWNDMYKEAGLSAGSEEKKRAFRLWVYITGALNGTSRAGTYNSIDVLADGTQVAAAVIPRVAGKDIRKFYRGNMEESYYALKGSGAMLLYPRFVTRMATFGASAEEAFAGADWFTDCPYFTPNEAIVHSKVFIAGISRARRARDGLDLEQVELNRVADEVRANGADVNDVGRASRVEF